MKHATNDEKFGVFQIAILVLSLFLLICFAADTFLKLPQELSKLLQGIDMSICGVFLVDFAVRFKRAANKLAFLKWGWIDLVASIPNVDVLRWGRLVRVLKVIRLFRGFRSMHRLLQALAQQKLRTGAVSLGTMSFLLVVFASLSVLVVEQHPDSNIKTAGDAFWWAMSTVTTVGYGDRYPVTVEGRVLGMLLMLTGVGMYGGLSGIIASVLVGRREDEGDGEVNALKIKIEQLHEKMDRLLEQKTPRASNLKALPPVLIMTFIALWACPSYADIITLTAGREISGTVVATNHNSILILTDSGTISYARSIVKTVTLQQDGEIENLNGRLPSLRSFIRRVAAEAWATSLRQIPAVVIDVGIMRNVPYVSYSAGEGYEINIYGDPQSPAAIEVGVQSTASSERRNCMRILQQVLRKEDSELLGQLNLGEDKRTVTGMTFEVTPPGSADAYGKWWVSVYSESGLALARASDNELKLLLESDPAAGGGNASPGRVQANSVSLITFTNASGEVMSNAEPVRVIDGVALVWRKKSSGGSVRLALLSPELRKRFGYSELKTAQADEAEKARRKRDSWESAAALAAAARARDEAGAARPNADGADDTPGGYSGTIPKVSTGSFSSGRTYVRSYYRTDGTYVSGHSRRR